MEVSLQTNGLVDLQILPLNLISLKTNFLIVYNEINLDLWRATPDIDKAFYTTDNPMKSK